MYRKLYVRGLGGMSCSWTETEIFQVTFASPKNISFLATGGGHGFSTTFGELRNGLEIDLRNFKQISINKDASTMIVGGGVQIGEVIGPLFNAGKEMRKSKSDVSVLMYELTGLPNQRRSPRNALV